MTSRTPIICLFLTRCPSTIVASIRSVVINALKCKFRGRPWPHIGVEPFKAIAPLIGHVNSSGSVKMVVLARWIVAALLSMLPYHPFGSSAFEMLCIACNRYFRLMTSATFASSAKDGVRAYDGLISASAATKEISHACLSSSNLLEQRPPIKSKSNEITWRLSWIRHEGIVTQNV